MVERMEVLQSRRAAWLVARTDRCCVLRDSPHDRASGQTPGGKGARRLGPTSPASGPFPRLRAICGSAAQDALPNGGQEDVGSNAGTCRFASGHDDRRTNSQGEARAATTNEGASRFQGSRGHREKARPRLAYRPDGGPCGGGDVVAGMASLCPAAAVAVLLAGLCRGRSFLTSRHGDRRLRDSTRLSRRARMDGWSAA